ncbi:MAG: DUF167 domain-containing protein [Leptospirales bacterium]
MREIKVRVHPKSSKSEFIQKGDTYHAYIHAPPEKGKANKETIELIAKEFKQPKTHIRIIRGEKSRDKVFEF